jgi:Skp family chaperone for outer membrane proteins
MEIKNMKRTYLTTFIVVFAVLATGALSLGAGAMLVAKPTAIAIVDVVKVRNALEEAREVTAEIERSLQAFQNEDKARMQAIEELRQDLELLEPNTDAYAKKRQDLLFRMVEARTWQEVKKAELNSEHAIQLERLYMKIVGASRDVGQLNGFDMVLAAERQLDFSKANAQEIDALVALRKLLWYTPEINITDQVIQKMNNDYANGM